MAELFDKKTTNTRSFSFPKSLRLLNSKSYDPVFKARQKISGRFLLLLYRENAITVPRLGVIVAKKNVKRAVARNRIKRLMRESFRLHQHDIGHFDVVLLAHKGADQATNDEIRKDLELKWSRLNCLNKQSASQ